MTFTPALTVFGLGLRIGKIVWPAPRLRHHARLDRTARVRRDHGGWRAERRRAAAVHAISPCQRRAAAARTASRRASCATPARRRPSPRSRPRSRSRSTAPSRCSVSLRAGDGDGPWWIAIQKGFGPLYLEQVGFGARAATRALETRLAADGRLGLAVRAHGGCRRPSDHLLHRARRLLQPGELGGRPRGPRGVGQHGRRLDRGGLLKRQATPTSSTSACCSAGSASTGSRSSAATARESTTARSSPRSSPSAPSTGRSAACRRSSSPASAAASASTAARRADRSVALRRLPAHPGARHRRARRRTRWMQLRALGSYFPMQPGTFWFAAGLSFNSFALVDGIAVRRGADRRRARHQPARPRAHGAAPAAGGARLDRARAARPLLEQRGRDLGAGPAHGQLVAALPGRQAHGRLRLRDLVQGRARAASSC